MNKLPCPILLIILLLPLYIQAQTKPLTLIQTIEMPDVPSGPWADHICVDVTGHRLFTTMQAQKALVVLDLDKGTVIQNIPVGNPHSCAYRGDLHEIFVNDSDPINPGVKIFSDETYKLIRTVPLLHRTDSMGYDPHLKYIYAVNGGESENLDYSLVSIIDTTKGEHIGDIKVESATLEDMDVGESGLIYITAEEKNQVMVLDPQKRTVVTTWPLMKAKTPVATVVDESDHRLFVACRTGDYYGEIVVFDTRTGKELKTLPIESWLDYMAFDQHSGRLYAFCGLGHVYVYQKKTPDDYVLLQKAETGLLGKTGLVVPELHRLYVVLPNLAWKPAKVLVFSMQ